MAALTRLSLCATALATTIAAGTSAAPDTQTATLAERKMSPGLRAAYVHSAGAGGDIDLPGICNGSANGGRDAARGTDSLLVMLATHGPCADEIAGLRVRQCHSGGRVVVVAAPGGQADASVSLRQLEALTADPVVSHVEVDCRYAFTGAAVRPPASGCPQKFPCRAGAPGCTTRAACAIEAPPALRRWADGKLWGPESIGALNVYDELPGMSDAGLLIAVLDSGVYYEDSVFAGRIWQNAAEAAGAAGVDDDDNGCVDDLHGCAFQSGRACDHASDDLDLNCDPVDLTGHGSAVAEVIAALGPGKILPVRLGNFSSGYSKSNYVAAIDYVDSFARDNPDLKTIVNLSQTMAPHSASPAIGHAIANSPSLFVIAVGNFDTVEYPAAYGYDNIVQVSAIGPHACNEPPALTSFLFDDEVDLVAPGTEICTSFGCREGATECLAQGTSLAAPHVTAAAAMYLHEHPTATAQQTRATLIERAGALKSLDISFLAGAPRRCACD